MKQLFNSQAYAVLEIRSVSVIKTLEDEWYVVIKGCISLSMQVFKYIKYIPRVKPTSSKATQKNF